MSRYITRIVIFFLLVSLAAIAQISVIYVWPGFLGEINLVLITLVILLFFNGFKSALVAAIVSGFWLDLFSFNIFGANMLALVITVVLAERVAMTWLTNKSLYSFVIINLLMVLSANLLISLFFYFSNFDSTGFFLLRSSFWTSIFYQLIWSFTAAFLSFNFSSLLNRKFEPVFLGDRFLEKK